MDMDEAVRSRHSVRQYTDRRIEGETLSRLQSEIDAINSESGLRIRLITDEPKAFGGVLMRSVVRFKGAVNYFAITGTDSDDLEERAGYYGERLVLYAQTLGLNTCWAMLAGRKESERRIDEGFEHVINIAVGYGENQGTPHKNRSVDSVADLADAPEWFSRGVEYAMMAPTGMNKQGFRFEREGDRVRMVTGTSKLAKIDRGIVRYHFELGAGKDSFSWMERGAPASSEIGRIRSRGLRLFAWGVASGEARRIHLHVQDPRQGLHDGFGTQRVLEEPRGLRDDAEAVDAVLLAEGDQGSGRARYAVDRLSRDEVYPRRLEKRLQAVVRYGSEKPRRAILPVDIASSKRYHEGGVVLQDLLEDVPGEGHLALQAGGLAFPAEQDDVGIVRAGDP